MVFFFEIVTGQRLLNGFWLRARMDGLVEDVLVNNLRCQVAIGVRTAAGSGIVFRCLCSRSARVGLTSAKTRYERCKSLLHDPYNR